MNNYPSPQTIEHMKKEIGHLYPGVSYLEDKVIEWMNERINTLLHKANITAYDIINDNNWQKAENTITNVKAQ